MGVKVQLIDLKSYYKATSKKMAENMTNMSKALEQERQKGLKREEKLQQEIRDIQQSSRQALKQIDEDWKTRIRAMNKTYEDLAADAKANKDLLIAMQNAFEKERMRYQADRAAEVARFREQFQFLRKVLVGHIENTNSVIASIQSAIKDIRFQLRQMSHQITLHLKNQSKLIE